VIGRRCPECKSVLRRVAAHNLWSKHALCPACGVIYVIWGQVITPCETPTKCVPRPWLICEETLILLPRIQPGPAGRGLL